MSGLRIDEVSPRWHVIPKGLAHGGLLAAVATLLTWGLAAWRWPARLVAVPLAGWLGWLASWPPLAMAVGLNVMPDPAWPGLLLTPFLEFGSVAALAFLGWGALRQLGARRPGVHPAIGVAAGVLGSLPFWIAIEVGSPWYALPHGAAWGGLVGLGAWSAGRRARAPGGAGPAEASQFRLGPPPG